jgi:hypothetical protein
MRKFGLSLWVGLGIAALAAPVVAMGSTGFMVRIGDITGEGGKLDKKSGQQLVPISSWFWGEYVVAEGAAPVAATLQRQGYYDQGSVRVNAVFTGCEVGKHFGDAELRTPGVRYAFQDVIITKCRPASLTFNYGKIRASSGW